MSIRLETMKQTVERHGSWIGNTKACSTCGKNRLFLIRFDGGAKDYFAACDLCDVDKLEK